MDRLWLFAFVLNTRGQVRTGCDLLASISNCFGNPLIFCVFFQVQVAVTASQADILLATHFLQHFLKSLVETSQARH